MAMNCAELEQEWERRFADSLVSEAGSLRDCRPWSAEAEAHFATCAGCRQRLQAEALLDQALGVWLAQPLPSAVVPAARQWLPGSAPVEMPAIAAHALRQVSVQSRSRSLWSQPAMVAASCLAFVAAGWLLVQPGHEVPLQVVSTAVVPEDSAVTDSLALMLSDVRIHSEAAARSTVASLDRWPSSVVVAAASHPLAVPTLPTERPAEVIETRSQQNWSQWGSPLGQQVGGAFQFLNEVLPEMAGPAG